MNSKLISIVAAEKELKAAAEESTAENERGKLDVAKKVAAPAPAKAVETPAPAKPEDRENVLNLIDQLSEESKAK